MHCKGTCEEEGLGEGNFFLIKTLNGVVWWQYVTILCKESISLVLCIYSCKKIGKITGIKKSELHDTTVYFVNCLLVPYVVGIHYFQFPVAQKGISIGQ